ncbi:MAG TPA: FAD-dependent oxidoreductase [Candidatus Limnocylindrales bacterium]|nr:FAD-dependent oxidoreductase [Candidatus Limnocylindrales bacterium]
MTSLWLSASRASVDAGEPPGEADVAVVGAGLLGVCCAYWLARLGAKVVVLEQQAVASGATGRNSGLVVPTTAEPYDQAVGRLGAPVAAAVRRLAIEGSRLLEQIVAEEQLSCRYRPGGFVQLALDDQDAAQCRAEIEVTGEHGFEAAWLDRDAVQSCLGTRLRDTIAGAMLLPGAMTNSVALVDGIVTAARRHGARIYTGVRVSAVRPHGRHALVDTTHGTIRARVVVTAINAWLADLVPAWQTVVRPVQGQLIATSPMPQMFPCGMAAQLTAHGEYWQQLPDGTILLGGCRSVAPPPADPLAQRAQPAVHQALQQVLPTLFPDLGRVSVQRGWAGAMAFTPDWIPVVDKVAESVWAIGGFCGHGMPFGASISRILATHIVNGSQLAEVAHLRLNRPTLPAA